MSYRTTLIEVALPVSEINDALIYDKMPGIGAHPKGIHHWWARLPLPEARAVLFASVVDDPSAHPERFPTEEAQERERERLFGIIRKLMQTQLQASRRASSTANRLDGRSMRMRSSFYAHTVDLPDELYRALKARAALNGVTVRDLLRRYVEQGLKQPSVRGDSGPGRRQPPPVIIPPQGVSIPALPRAQVRRLEEEEDEARHARSAPRPRASATRRRDGDGAARRVKRRLRRAPLPAERGCTMP